MQHTGSIKVVAVPRLVVRQKGAALVAGVLAIVAAVLIATSALGSSGSPSVAPAASTGVVSLYPGAVSLEESERFVEATSLYPGAVSLEESKRFFEGTPR